MKNKTLRFLLLLFLLLFTTLSAFAEDEMPAEQKTLIENLAADYPKMAIKEDYSTVVPIRAFRFPVNYPNIQFFDPMEMTNFPHQTLGEGDSGTYLFRYTRENPKAQLHSFGFRLADQEDWKYWGYYDINSDGKVWKQQIYLPEAATTAVYYGQSKKNALGTPGITYAGNFDDFYLYADFFVSGTYPENSGGCFLSMSNSLSTSASNSQESYDGQMIAYETDRYRGTVINIDSGTQEFKQASQLFFDQEIYYIYRDYQNSFDTNMDKYSVEPCRDASCPSIGNDIFPALYLNDKFAADYEGEKAAFEKKGLSYNPAIYRVEIIRKDGEDSLFINGKFIKAFKDHIPGKVFWGIGTVIYEGGRQATCGVGNFAVYTPVAK